ncbi:AEC family transporter [Geosporobacter ferrireducens]|uniref:Malate permease n=2 Tax=Geosporobacter ferrireducens TaxID=1424294 RepID=A0A1D8GMH6_9FIRM|nr:malate permease [Geosporobacter ferrireducens]AOT72128.1 malate permease [Geosporobacter ferrireducens]MTI56016.1 malate permease [Geosporobacter ferrireducens]
MADIFARIIPILLLISIGQYFQYKNTFQQSTIDEIKHFITNVALSAVLFIAFINMELKAEYFMVFVIVFILLNVLFFSGFMVSKIKGMNHPLIPFIVTGNSFGLLGIPLFTTVFGAENVGKLSILGVGHEFFIWLVFITILRVKFREEKISFVVMKDIIKSPLIISIALGILFNITGLGTFIQENPFSKGFYITLQYLSSLATPLILIIIGYGLKFDKRYMKESVYFLFIRMILGFVIGYAFKMLIIDRIMSPDPIFNYAYFTFLILPPPLSLPIFMGTYSTKEHEELANNVVVVSTVFSIVLYILFVLTL